MKCEIAAPQYLGDGWGQDHDQWVEFESAPDIVDQLRTLYPDREFVVMHDSAMQDGQLEVVSHRFPCKVQNLAVDLITEGVVRRAVFDTIENEIRKYSDYKRVYLHFVHLTMCVTSPIGEPTFGSYTGAFYGNFYNPDGVHEPTLPST